MDKGTPYQESDGGAQASASPIYNKFVECAKSLNPNIITLIMPSRWYIGGKGLEQFRMTMLTDPHLKELHDFLNPSDVFPNTNIRGGVCVINWDKSYDNTKDLTRVVTYENGQIKKDIKRPLKIKALDIFIREYDALSILEKVNTYSGERLHEGKISDIASPRKPYGFSGFFIKDKRFHADDTGLTEPIVCYGKGAVGFVERSEIKNKTEWIDTWKVFTARANNIGTELNDDNFNTIIGEPGTICTETYIVIGADLDLDKKSANNLSNYLKTKFSRFLHSLAKSSQDAARTTYQFIPLQDFTSSSDIDWTQSVAEIDAQLYRKYALSQEEIDFIETHVKEMS
ncbi:MAG: Eco57I restriction-modification methylase domain-containing protein [Streptococcus hyointestinalis]|nr:Eco57I restriction-modification methylase domain-containing protein [Streptococcus hyointestinalis]MDD7355497.1 Eco57I restriction-modification methylase domain-containing protein [Streptococcus hyointestinalis]